MSGTIHLILGGARSGKSKHSERLAQELGGDEVVYVATAEARDAEMKSRIDQHISLRNGAWETVESSQSLGLTIRKLQSAPCVLVDCLTLWLSRSIESGNWQEERADLLEALKINETNVVLVSNEVGLGIVPMGKETREFVDEAGRLHQDVAEIASHVSFVVAGLPQVLKSTRV